MSRLRYLSRLKGITRAGVFWFVALNSFLHTQQCYQCYIIYAKKDHHLIGEFTMRAKNEREFRYTRYIDRGRGRWCAPGFHRINSFLIFSRANRKIYGAGSI